MPFGYNTLNAWPMARKLARQALKVTVTNEGEASLIQAGSLREPGATVEIAIFEEEHTVEVRVVIAQLFARQRR